MVRKLKLVLASSLLAGAFSISSVAVACPGHESEAKTEEKTPSGPTTVAMFRVDGMHCAGCSDHVKEALFKADGVIKVEVKQADKKVIVTFEKSKISAEKIAKMISDAGYPATAEV